MCEVVDPSGYGECATPLGFAFTGTDCEPVSGCGCMPNCDQFYDYQAQCRGDCLGCDTAKLAGAGSGTPPEPGGFCDVLEACVDVAWHRDIEGMVADVDCQTAPSLGCPNGHRCVLEPNGTDRYQDVCRLSRFEGVTNVVCTVFGP